MTVRRVLWLPLTAIVTLTLGAAGFILIVNQPSGSLKARVDAAVFKKTIDRDGFVNKRSIEDAVNEVRSPTGAAQVDNYCATQCWYDNLVVSPAGHPDVIYIGGSFDYPRARRYSYLASKASEMYFRKIRPRTTWQTD